MDGPGRGGAPLPWDMEEPPANMFKEEVLILIMIAMIFLDRVVTCMQVRVVTVPHTGVVKACHKCRGTGGMSCRDCSGKVSTRTCIIIILINAGGYEWHHHYRQCCPGPEG